MWYPTSVLRKKLVIRKAAKTIYSEDELQQLWINKDLTEYQWRPVSEISDEETKKLIKELDL